MFKTLFHLTIATIVMGCGYAASAPMAKADLLDSSSPTIDTSVSLPITYIQQAEWTQKPGCAKEISVGGAAPWDRATVVGCSSGGDGGNQIFQNENLLTGAGIKIAANDVVISSPWILDNGGGIWFGSQNKQPGCAREIAAGPAGVWITGCSAINGGFEIFRANLAYTVGQPGAPKFPTLAGVHSWQQMPGGATRLAVGNQAWALNNQREIFRFDESQQQWQTIPGCARSIAANGDHVWVIGCDRSGPGGYEIFEKINSGWKKHPGAAVKISVDGVGNPWVLSEDGAIFTWHRKSMDVPH
jgi:hypothetical protein